MTVWREALDSVGEVKLKSKICPGENAPGVLITFEGGDGSGKSTHVKFLAGLLEDLGLEVVCVREPGGTLIGEQLRAIVLDPENTKLSDRTELLIYEAARAQLIDAVIAPALLRGAIVLCDRFTDSSIVYQGYGRGLDLDFIRGLNDFATCEIKPDITMLFKCPDRMEKKSRVDRRGVRDRLEDAGEAFHAKVAEGFDDLAKSSDTRIKLITTGGKHSQTALAIFDALSGVLPFLSDGSIDLRNELAVYDAAHDHSKDKVPANEAS